LSNTVYQRADLDNYLLFLLCVIDFKAVKNPIDPTVFIIDKSSSYRIIIKNILEALGHYDLHTFSNTEECNTVKIDPDIIILDNDLGANSQSGLDFLRQKKMRFSKAHFLFLSSNTNLEIAVDSIRWGASDYIFKSKTGLEKLIVKLERLVNSEKEYYRKNLYYKAALISLGLVCIIFTMAVILYNHQLI
jgi:DNA-binding NarL/FixJ family response regulator